MSPLPSADAAGVSDLSVYLVYDTTGGPVQVGASHDQFASIRNGGPDSSPSLTVTVTASAGQQLAAQTSGSSYTCTRNFARTVLTCQHPAVVANAIVPLYWSVKYTTATSKTVTVKVSGPNADPDLSNNRGVLQTYMPSSDLRVAGAADLTGGPAVAGRTHEQSASFDNVGPDASPEMTVTVTASSGQQLTESSSTAEYCGLNSARTIMTCTLPETGTSMTRGVYWSVTYTTTGAKTVTVKVSGPNADPVPANNSLVIHTRQPTSDLSVTQATDDTGGSALQGTTHEQSVYVDNEGPDSSFGAVVTVKAESGQQLTPAAGFEECSTNLAKSVMTCTFGQITSLSGFRLRWSVKYTTATSKHVTITVSSPNFDPDPMDNGDLIYTPGPTSDLSVSGAIDATGGAAIVGATHEQSAFIANSGPDSSLPHTFSVTASAGQKLSSQMSSETCFMNSGRTTLTCRFGRIESGSGYRVYWSVTYTTASAKKVTVKVGGPNEDPDPSNNAATINTPAPKSDLRVSNAVDETGGAAVIGATHVQSAFIRNDGPHGSPPLTATVTASAGQRLTIASQHSGSCTLNSARTIMTCSVPGGVGFTRLEWSVTYTTGTAKTVTVTADGPYADPVASNNKAVINTAAPKSDLRVLHAVDETGGAAVIGATHVQSAYFRNDGPDVTPPMTATVVASAGQKLTIAEQHSGRCTLNSARTVMTCSVPGGLGTFLLEWSVTYTTGTAKTVTLTVDGPHPDPVTSNNKAIINTPAPKSDLRVSNAVDETGGAVVVGATHAQSAFINNDGPDGSPPLTVTVTASAGQQLTVAALWQQSCSTNSARSVMTCRVPGGIGLTRLYWSTTYSTDTSKKVTIKVDGPHPDPVTSNNTAVILTRGRTSDLAVTGVFDDTGGPVQLGVNHDQHAEIRNLGPDTSSAVVVTVVASAGQRLSPVEQMSDVCEPNRERTKLTCRLSFLGVVSDHVAWWVTYTTVSTKAVTVTITGPNDDPNTTNNKAVLRTYP